MLSTALLCTLLLPIAQSETLKTVTLEISGAPVTRVVADLGKAAGMNLLTSPAIANNVLAVGVKDVPVREVMDRIADVTSGAWQAEGDGFRLVPDRARQNREAQEEFRQKVERTRAALEGRGGNSSVLAAPSGNMVTVRSQGGAARPGTASFLRALDPSLLAGMKTGSRIVFSSSPTRMQRPLSPAVSAAIATTIREHNAQLSQRAPRNEATSDEERQAREFAARMGFRDNDQPIDPATSKALVIVASQGFPFQSITADLRIVNAKGETIYNQREMVMVQAPDPNMPEITVTPEGQIQQKPIPEEPNDQEIQMSERAKDFAGIYSNPMQGLTITPNLRELMMRPDLHEPLSFVPGEMVLGVAKAKGCNVVANLPDSMLGLTTMLRATTVLKLNASLKQLQGTAHTTAEIKDGWLTVRPLRPAEARIQRVDRVALQNLIAAAVRRGTPSIDDMAAYALRNESPLENFAAIYIGAFAPTALGAGMGGIVNWDTLRLYGSLSPTVRAQLRNGYEIGLGNLGPAQQAIAERILFGTEARLEVGSAETPGGLAGMAARFMPSTPRTWREEPTEVMPNGLPGSGVLQVTATEEEIGLIAGEGAARSMMGAVMDADTLGMLEYLRTTPMGSMVDAQMPAIKGLRMGRRTRIQFRFVVAPDVRCSHTLNDDLVSPNSPIVPLDQLPESFRKQISERAEAFKKDPLPFGIMGGGGMRARP